MKTNLVKWGLTAIAAGSGVKTLAATPANTAAKKPHLDNYNQIETIRLCQKTDVNQLSSLVNHAGALRGTRIL